MAIQRIRFKLGIDRKRFVLAHIRKEKCKSILEIGVFNGNFAERMITQAKKTSPKSTINYVGIDLFAENFSEKVLVTEVSLKPHAKNKIFKSLSKLNSCIELYEGESIETLPKLIEARKLFDLIVIDGGHSYSTVKNDFENSLKLLNNNGCIIFDDYTNLRGVVFGKFGINQVVHEIDENLFTKLISFNRDLFWKPYGLLVIRMVKVSRKIIGF